MMMFIVKKFIECFIYALVIKYLLNVGRCVTNKNSLSELQLLLVIPGDSAGWFFSMCLDVCLWKL
jgi:hypothetical protein